MRKELAAFVTGLLLGLSIFCINGVFSAEPHEPQGDVVISQEQFMQMQEMFGVQQRLLQDQRDKTYHWFKSYETLKECVRRSESHGAALVCTGDLYAHAPPQ